LLMQSFSTVKDSFSELVGMIPTKAQVTHDATDEHQSSHLLLTALPNRVESSVKSLSSNMVNRTKSRKNRTSEPLDAAKANRTRSRKNRTAKLVDPAKVNQTILREAIHSAYSYDEFSLLCTDFGTHYHDLSGSALEMKM